VFQRRAATLALLTAAVFASLAVSGPSRALAAGSTNYAYYELVNTRPTTVNDLIVTTVAPPNSITPPDAKTSPLTILDGSFGFDPKNLQVFLSPPDPTSEGMAIQFANGGLAPGGTLNFKVSLDPGVSAATVPRLQLQAPDADLKLVSLPPPSPPVAATLAPPVADVPDAPPPPAPNTPEPVSIALWSALAGAGLLRARAFRRAHRAAPG